MGDIEKDGKIIGKFVEMIDGTKIKFRDYSTSEPNANAVLGIVNKDSKAMEESAHFEFKYFDESDLPKEPKNEI